MRLILSQLPVSMSDQEMDEILRAVDANGDGVFDWLSWGGETGSEFSKLLFYFFRVMFGYREFDSKWSLLRDGKKYTEERGIDHVLIFIFMIIFFGEGGTNIK